MSLDRVISAFDLQVQWCEQMDAPFTAGLIRAAAADMRAGGVVAKLLGDWPGHPIADALMMRFTGALHAAALSGRDLDLAAHYPAAQPDWRMEQVWPRVLAFLARDEAWVRDFLKSPPQTNETRRAIALLPGFLSQAKHGPMHLFELGASAGLNSMWSRFRYETETWKWGEPDGPRVTSVWNGPPPRDLDGRPEIASRACCDQNPLDVRNPGDVLRLKSYVWAEQRERFERLEAVMALAHAADVRVDRADAEPWLAAKLEGDPPEGVTVIYHSVFWQYLPPEKRAAITSMIEQAGARATPRRRLAWLCYEASVLFGVEGPVDQMATVLRSWPGDERQVLARGDGHARVMKA